MLKNHNEWYCLDHGTMTFEMEPWDIVESPAESYEAENGGQSWSQEEVTQLLEYDDQGLSAEKIAKLLGRTKNAIYNKLWACRS